MLYRRMVAGSGVMPTQFVINCYADPLFQTWRVTIRASDFSARLFRQGVANVKEDTRYEYLEDTGMDLARP